MEVKPLPVRQPAQGWGEENPATNIHCERPADLQEFCSLIDFISLKQNNYFENNNAI